MYIPDLSPYSYMNFPVDPKLLAVGWLDGDHAFPKGGVPEDLLREVLALCFKPANRTRGFHQSPFRPVAFGGYVVSFAGKQMALGSAEIRVQGGDVCFAAPNLIYHYIKDCHYLPPQLFLDALANLNSTHQPTRLPPRP